MNEKLNIVPFEKAKLTDGEIYVDEVSVTYGQNGDCTDTDNPQFIKITTRNNGIARFLNIDTSGGGENVGWSISDENELLALIEDFKKRAMIEDDEKKNDGN